MFRKLLPLLLVVPFFAIPAAASATVAIDEPCLEPGDCTTLCFDRPPLERDGDPVDAEWVDGGTGRPTGWEDDPFFDDSLGELTGSDPACITICNDGGNLEGPNGDDQNEGTEGDCIEVMVCWTYRYQVTIATTSSTTTGGGGGSGLQSTSGSSSGSTTTYRAWRTAKKCSQPETVCACD